MAENERSGQSERRKKQRRQADRRKSDKGPPAGGANRRIGERRTSRDRRKR